SCTICHSVTCLVERCILTPLFRWPNSLCHYTHTFDPVDLADQVDVMSAYSTNEPFFLSQLKIPYREFSPRSVGIDFFGDNLFTSEALVKSSPQTVESFREASLLGWRYALEHHDTVINWITSRYKSTYSREFLRFEADATYNLIQPNLVEVGYINEGRWHQVVKDYQALKKLSPDFQLGPVLYHPPEQLDYRQFLLVAAVVVPTMLVLLTFALFVVRTNKKLDVALKESDQARAEVAKQANLDPLTELSNRRLFQTRLSSLCSNAEANNAPFALFYLDLDRFKELNDLHGHQEGDRVLKIVSSRLLNALPSHCELARIGGDEFTVLIPGKVDKEILAQMAEQILAALSKPFSVKMELVYLSASIGITVSPDDATDPSSLLQFADEAMYAAKNLGRSRYHFFSLELHTQTQERQKLLNDLREAITHREIYVVYQPIVCLQTGKVKKFEALARWQHPNRGAIPPDVFIPLAEESGLITQIGDFVFKESVSQLARWRMEIAPDLVMSINTSPFQYTDSGKHLLGWYQHIESLMLPGSSVILEITENMLMHHTANVAEQLLAFRDFGINVALDDFGTGYSSLAYLNRLDIDFIKIDKSFIHDLSSGPMAKDLCEAIISMAHKLSLQVVAEGIETKEQAKLLASYGCDLGQGYWFAKPLNQEAATALLLQQREL
ncbi:EAL domain-containing protein, partial [Maribrevibacterium harenarium]